MNKLDNFKFGTVGSPKATPKRPGGSVGAIIFMKELGAVRARDGGYLRADLRDLPR